MPSVMQVGKGDTWRHDLPLAATTLTAGAGPHHREGRSVRVAEPAQFGAMARARLGYGGADSVEWVKEIQGQFETIGELVLSGKNRGRVRVIPDTVGARGGGRWQRTSNRSAPRPDHETSSTAAKSRIGTIPAIRLRMLLTT